MSGAGRSFAVALVAHAVMIVAADQALPHRAAPPELPVEIEIVEEAPPPEEPAPPPENLTAMVRDPAVVPPLPPVPPVPVPPPTDPVTPPPRERITARTTDPTADAITVEPTVPEDDDTPGAFAMRTDRDELRPEDARRGSGSISLTPRLPIDYTPPPVMERPVIPRIPGAHDLDHSEMRPDGEGKRKDDLAYEGKIDRHGTVHMEDKRTFDATDAIMKALGEDPYAARKLAFLDRTREERAEMARKALEEDLKESLGKLAVYLTKIWKSSKWSAVERREVYFQLWDECYEAGDGDGQARADGGVEARRQIIEFIRARMPEGGENAYTEAELEALNAKRSSRQRFDPYP